LSSLVALSLSGDSVVPVGALSVAARNIHQFLRVQSWWVYLRVNCETMMADLINTTSANFQPANVKTGQAGALSSVKGPLR
jgi:hypothetical protein